MIGWLRRVFSPSDPERPRVGLGVVVIKDRKVLLGRRRGSHCAGQISLPGGGLDVGESFAEGAKREVWEETNLRIRIRPYDELRTEWYVVNNVLAVGSGTRHYTGVFIIADWVGGEPMTMEPEKNDGWAWAAYEEIAPYTSPGDAWLPTELFETLRKRRLI